MALADAISGIWKPFARQASVFEYYPIHSIPQNKAATLYIKPDGTGRYENKNAPFFAVKSAPFKCCHAEGTLWELCWVGGIDDGDRFGVMDGGDVDHMLTRCSADYEAKKILLHERTMMLLLDVPPAGQAMYYYRVGDWF